MDHSSLYRKVLLILFCFMGCFCYGQKTELRANAYSGLFFFRGNGSSSNSTVSVGDDIGYYNPFSYGTKSGFSYSPELQVQRVTKRQHLFGLGISYENLKSKAIVDSFNSDMGKRSATGTVIMTNTFITVNPFIGQRFIFGEIEFDTQIGIDFSFNCTVNEEARLTSLNETYTLSKAKHPMDLRPRVQLNASYKHMGLLAGYSLGLENLYAYDNPNYTNKKAYANFLRFGISYRLSSFNTASCLSEVSIALRTTRTILNESVCY